MPRGTERILTYVRERDAQGRLVIRAVPVLQRPEAEHAPTTPGLEPVGHG